MNRMIYYTVSMLLLYVPIFAKQVNTKLPNLKEMQVTWSYPGGDYFKLEWSPFKQLYKEEYTAKLTITDKSHQEHSTAISSKFINLWLSFERFELQKFSSKIRADREKIEKSKLKRYLFENRLTQLIAMCHICDAEQDQILLPDLNQFHAGVKSAIAKIKNNKAGYIIKYPKKYVLDVSNKRKKISKKKPVPLTRDEAFKHRHDALLFGTDDQ